MIDEPIFLREKRSECTLKILTPSPALRGTGVELAHGVTSTGGPHMNQKPFTDYLAAKCETIPSVKSHHSINSGKFISLSNFQGRSDLGPKVVSQRSRKLVTQPWLRTCARDSRVTLLVHSG